MIDTTLVNETPKSILYISSDEINIPSNVIQGKREPGHIYKDGKISEWYWQGFTQQNGNRYIYFEPLNLQPLETLFTMNNKEFLFRIGEIAELLKAVDGKSYIPQDAFYLLEGSGVLLLPYSIMELMKIGKNKKRVQDTYEKWVRPGFRDEKVAVYQLTSYLYHFIAGEAPLENPDSRDDTYKPVPVNLFPGNLNPKAGSWIQSILIAKKTDEIPDISTWISEFTSLKDEFFIDEPINTSTKLETYLATREKRVKRKRFLRKRGSLLMVLTIISTVVLVFLGSMLSNALAPPVTAGLPPEEMLALYYQSQNDLDTELLSDCLDSGVKSEAENMVTYLFVTSRTRLAYEQNDGLVSAQEWLDLGKPEVNPTSLIYGVTDLKITQLDEDTYLAEYDLWVPASGELEETEEIVGVRVEQRNIREELDVRLKKDYWVITEIRKIYSELVD